jgi:hypothetical protein
MSNLRDNRVLCRLGARELTVDEAELVTGAGPTIPHTNVCSLITIATATQTGPGDGDACGDTDFA